MSAGLHIGHIMLDQRLRLEAWPQPGQEVRICQWERQVGGSATNTAIVVARFLRAARLAACMGDDAAGAWLRERLQQVPGLNLAHLQTAQALPTGRVLVLTTGEGPERTLLTWRGANDALGAPPPAALEAAPPLYVHWTGYAAQPAATAQSLTALLAWACAHRQVRALFFDLNPYAARAASSVLWRWLEQLAACSKTVVLSANLEAARTLLDAPQAEAQTLLAVLRGYAPVVALKMGPRGAWLATTQGRVFVPPVAVPAVDATAAGDAFVAGLIIGWRAGWNWAVTGHWAALLGALATTVPAGGLALPGPDAVRAYLAAHPEAAPAAMRRVWLAWLGRQGARGSGPA